MSTYFDKAIQNADQVNLATAILGGASAHSYREMGLNGDTSVQDVEDSVIEQPLPYVTAQSLALAAAANPVRISQVPVEAARLAETGVGGSIDGSLAPFAEVFAPEGLKETGDVAESDYRTNPSESDFLSNASFVVDPENGISAASTLLDAGLEESTSLPASLLELIQRALEEAESSREGFSTEFDGSGQGQRNVREWIGDSVQDLGALTRDFLQDEIRGEGRELVQDFVDALGSPLVGQVSEPLLNVDYYQVSADVINGLLESTFEPIGSVTLPSVGPLLANPREELTAYLG
ncbi:MAG TPA: hypothetical protein VFV57_10675 [Limnobacter sp.]|nr:hypothetical protein [Limnobacter sp.]